MSASVQLWRIGTDAPAYEAHDLTGRGAELTGGRWNREGTPLVYASTTRALACLETVVHLGSGDPLPLNRYLVEITVPAELWGERTVFDPAAHVGWDAEPAGRVSLDWGTGWAAGGSALLAEVPSVIVPEEVNVLINPRHPAIGSVVAVKQRRWTYDARLRRPLRWVSPGSSGSGAARTGQWAALRRSLERRVDGNRASRNAGRRVGV